MNIIEKKVFLDDLLSKTTGATKEIRAQKYSEQLKVLLDRGAIKRGDIDALCNLDYVKETVINPPVQSDYGC